MEQGLSHQFEHNKLMQEKKSPAFGWLVGWLVGGEQERQ